MGNGFELECLSCKYTMTILEGVGFMYYKTNVFYGRESVLNNKKCFEKPLIDDLIEDKEILKMTKELLSKGAEADDYAYGHVLQVCSKCNRVANNFYFKLKVEANAFYEPNYKCDFCGAPMKTKHDCEYSDNLNCPKCGGEMKHTDFRIYWD